MSLRLGAQVERRYVRRHGHVRLEVVPGGETFARLFPSLVGHVLEVGAKGLTVAPGMMPALTWLSKNGYFLRGGLHS